jgi:hypothetical protein
VTAVYEGQWLLAQVDIKQDESGDSHVNLSYMQRISDNQFKWPKHHDLLLTLKEDILTRCSIPVMVGSSIRANYVGLSPKEAHEANSALASMVYLLSYLFQHFFQPLRAFTCFFYVPVPFILVWPILPLNDWYCTVQYGTMQFGTLMYGIVNSRLNKNVT